MNRSQLTLLLSVLAAGSMAYGQQDPRGNRRNGPGGFSSSSSSGVAETPTNTTPHAKELAIAYNNLLNTSIFARDRRSGALTREVQTVDPPPSPENFLTFRGVGWEDGQVTAFVTDTRDDSSMRVRVGDTIATGKVAEIDTGSNELVYASKDGLTKRHIALGTNLAGREMEAPQVASAVMPAGGGGSLADLQSFFQQRRGRGGPGGFGNNGGGFGNNFGNGFGNNFGNGNFGNNFGNGGFGNGGFGTNGGGFDPTQQRRQRGGGGGGNYDPNADPNATGGGRRRQRGGGGGGGQGGFGG